MNCLKILFHKTLYVISVLTLVSCGDSEAIQQKAKSIEQTAKEIINAKNIRNDPTNKQPDCSWQTIKFIITNNQGNNNHQGGNNVIIFDPKSKELDFKVSLGLNHKIYTKNLQGKLLKQYVPKSFRKL